MTMKIEGTSLRYPIDDAIRVTITGGQMHVISRNSPTSAVLKSIFSVNKDLSLTVNSKIGSLVIDGKSVDGVKAVRVSDRMAKIIKANGETIDFMPTSRSQCTINA